MGKMNFKMWLKLNIARIGWNMFIWANDTTEDKYWKLIYKIERERELSEQRGNCNKPAVINNEAVICKDCGKYKKTQGNGIMHQLCECASEVAACGDCYYAGDCDSAALNERCKHFMANF